MHNHDTTWISKWGGICQGRFETDVPIGMFADTLNFSISATGAIVPRPGYSSLTRTPDNKPQIAVYPMDWDGSLSAFIATEDHVYRMTFSLAEIPVWTLIHTWTTKAEQATFAPINTNTSPHIVFGNGKDAMLKYDGTTTTALPADAPKGLPIAYKNYLAVFGITTYPGRVQFNINNGDTDVWLIGGVPRTLELQGKVSSIYPYTGLLIFTDRRTEIFNGDPDSVQGQSVLSEVVGCVEHNTVCEAEGMLVWMSYSGVSYWNGGGVFPTGILSDEEGERVSNISEDMRRVAWQARKSFSFTYNPILRQLFASIRLVKPDFSGTEYRTYCFDMHNQAWFPWDLEAHGMAVIISPTTSKAMTIAGFSDGTIAFAEPGVSNASNIDEMAATSREFDYFIRSGSTDFGGPEYDKIVRAICMRISPASGSEGVREIDMSFRGDFLDTGLSETTELRFGFVLGIGMLGDQLSGASDLETRRPVAIRARYFAWKIAGKGSVSSMPIQALGISFRAHSKRSVMVWNSNIR
jgi:hypothetical protein